MIDSDPTPVLPETPPKTPAMQLNWKTVGAALIGLVGILTQAGVIPVAAAPSPTPPPPPCAPCDGSFQSDVRASLERLSASVTDIRERLARLEGPSR